MGVTLSVFLMHKETVCPCPRLVVGLGLMDTNFGLSLEPLSVSGSDLQICSPLFNFLIFKNSHYHCRKMVLSETSNVNKGALNRCCNQGFSLHFFSQPSTKQIWPSTSSFFGPMAIHTHTCIVAHTYIHTRVWLHPLPFSQYIHDLYSQNPNQKSS